MGQAFAQPVAFVNQPFVIQAEQMQHRGVPVLDADAIFHRRVTDFVGVTEDEPLFHAPPGHPGGETIRAMIAAGDVHLC